MADLVAFLNARLDEDEAAAKAAPGVRWKAFTDNDIAGASVYDEQWLLLGAARYDHDNPLSATLAATGPMYIQKARNELTAHIARHDPTRVLREVEAKRKILAIHERVRSEFGSSDALGCATCDYDSDCQTVVANDDDCRTVRALAAIYYDHPDYRQDWAT